jgi:hypothetical protein
MWSSTLELFLLRLGDIDLLRGYGGMTLLGFSFFFALRLSAQAHGHAFFPFRLQTFAYQPCSCSRDKLPG